jgi:hypothetical protein
VGGVDWTWFAEICDTLFAKTWWSYPASHRGILEAYYHWFNLAEGCAWLGCAAYVAWRYLRHRHSPLEVSYACAFVLFGCTDFWEAHQLTSWLLWLKLANLIVLFRLSWLVKKRFYPMAKTL